MSLTSQLFATAIVAFFLFQSGALVPAQRVFPLVPALVGQGV